MLLAHRWATELAQRCSAGFYYREASAGEDLRRLRSDVCADGIVKLSRIGLPDPQHAWFTFTIGLDPIIWGVSQSSFR